jgi:branched-chain amino acid transport system substrate-binding protein
VRGKRVLPVLVALSAGLTVFTSACGGASQTIRIGVLSDCEGYASFLYEPTMAAALLPLVERGARPLGDQPSDGVTAVTVAGKRLEVVIGCAASSSSSAVAEARRLVEREGAEMIVGPMLTEVGAVKQYAKRRPEVAFLMTLGQQSATLRDPLPNVFSFYLDETEAGAGLGSYAYRVGWRKAVTVGDDNNLIWGYMAGVVAEFCALGGQVVKRVWIPAAADPASVVAAVPKAGIDGIFYVSGGGRLLFALMNGLPLLRGGLAGRLVGNGSPLVDPSAGLGNRRAGAVYSTGGTNSNPSAPYARYTARLAKAWPKVFHFAGLLAPTNGFGLGYYDSMEAALRALERVGGDVSEGERRFQAALEHVELDAPNGHVRLDRHRQAIAPNYLNRLALNGKGQLTVRTFETVPDVEQTFGGLFSSKSPPPGRTTPPCKRGRPPAWAR